ncbi:MAG TPA: type II toxin-antitoxin system VapC family toxin [Longimicrobium sp.]|nr:type II toxin-antitoxin system VapC family toxin [Longimicrobium sp.]
MGRVLVDTNVLLDVFTQDPVWFDWSSDALADLAETSSLVVNPIIYAEVSVRFASIEALEQALPSDRFEREALPWEAAFLAGKSYIAYRKRGGERRSPLPDFYIGAHAAVRGMTLLTRDAARYRTYFPTLQLVAP